MFSRPISAVSTLYGERIAHLPRRSSERHGCAICHPTRGEMGRSTKEGIHSRTYNKSQPDHGWRHVSLPLFAPSLMALIFEKTSYFAKLLVAGFILVMPGTSSETATTLQDKLSRFARNLRAPRSARESRLTNAIDMTTYGASNRTGDLEGLPTSSNPPLAPVASSGVASDPTSVNSHQAQVCDRNQTPWPH